MDAATPGGGCVLANLARNGARAAHVRHDQLPWALAIRPHLASVVVGGNDVLRGDFAAHKIGADIDIVVRELRAAGATVLMATMPRPGQAVPLPRALAKVLAARIGDLNQVYRRLAVAHDALLLDLATHPAATARTAWHIDGIHPSVTGHRLLAEGFAGLLRRAGWPVGPVVSSAPAPVDTARQLAWLVRHGTPWLAKRSLDLVPTLAWLMARQVLHDCIASVGERGPRHR